MVWRVEVCQLLYAKNCSDGFTGAFEVLYRLEVRKYVGRSYGHFQECV